MSTEPNAPAAESAPAEGQDTAAEDTKIVAAAEENEPDGKAPKPDEGEQEPAETDEDEQDEDDGKPRKRSRTKRLQARMQALTAENERLSAALTRREAAAQAPKEADFNGDYAAYDRAQRAFEVKQAIREADAERDTETRARVQAEIAQERAAIYRERVQEVIEVIPDFEKVISAANVPIRDEVADLIQESEKGPQLAYHLAKNPAQLRELNRMSPLSAAREIGRLEARLSLPTPKTTTKAPAPVTSVKGGAKPAPQLGKTMSDYERWRNS
jgi:hypothetical protein